MRIAILEDDAQQVDMTVAVSLALGHLCVPFDSGETLLRHLRREVYDLLILDWQVPGATGFEVLQWLRERASHPLPVLFVTNQADERSIIDALDAGADDYMIKPVRVSELAARIAALLRRAWPQAQQTVLTMGDYCLRQQTSSVSLRGEDVLLKHKEFALAWLLFTNAGRLLSRGYLLESVWGSGARLTSRTLDTHLSRLRGLLALRPENGCRLCAVYSHGYRFEMLDETGAPVAPPP